MQESPDLKPDWFGERRLLSERKSYIALSNRRSNIFPVGTRYCGDIGFLLDLHCDIDQLRTEAELTLLYDFFFQYHNDVVEIK